MRLSEEGEIISDSGHTVLFKRKDGSIDGWQHSLGSLPQEDRDMFARPEEIWEEFFRQQAAQE